MKIKSNAIWLIACRVGADLLSLLLFVVISRRFGPIGIGEFSYGFAVATLTFVVAALGIDTYGVKHFLQISPAQRPAWLADLLGTQIVLVLAAAAALCLYMMLTAPTASMLAVILELTAYQVMVAVARTWFVPSVAREHMMFPAVSDLACRGIAVGVALLAIEASAASVPMALLGFPLAGMLLMAVAVASSWRHGVRPGIRISRTALLGIGATLWSYAAAEVVAQIFARIGLMTLTVELGAAATGLYAAGLKLLEMAYMPLVFLGVAAYPRLVDLHAADPPAFRKLADTLLWVMVLMSGTLAWGLYYVAPVVVVPVLGAKFTGTEAVLRVMALVAVVQAAESVLWPLMLAAELQVARLTIIIVATVTSLVLNLVLISWLGTNGAIIATFVSLLLIVLLFARSLRHVLGTRLLLPAFATLAGALLVAGSVAWFARHQGVWGEGAASLAAFLAVTALGYRFRRE